MSINVIVCSTHMKFFFDDSSKEEKKNFEELLEDKFSANDTSMSYDYRVKRGWMNPIKCFYNKDHGILNVGFLPFVKIHAKRNNFNLIIHERRKFVKPDSLIKEKIESNDFQIGKYILRDYQLESLQRLINIPQGGILNLPMASGKTLISAAICHLYKKANILLIFDSVDLINQTYKYFVDECHIKKKEIGIVGMGIDDSDKRITLLSMMSYQNLFHEFPRMHIIISDEVHKTGRTDVAEKIIYSCQNATIRIGLSATPDRIDNPYEQMKLYGNMGPIIYRKEVKEQMDAGILADSKIFMIKHKSLNPVRIIGSWPDVYRKKLIKEKDIEKFEKDNYEIIKEDNKFYARKFVEYGDESLLYTHNEIRNNKIVEIAKQNNRVLVLFSKIRHGKILKELLPNAFLISGKTSAEERNEVKKELGKDKNTIILSSSIWDIGISIDEIENLIIASAGVSTLRTIQKVGRAFRKSKKINKTTAIIWDFWSEDNAIGVVQSKKRYDIYTKILKLPVEII